MTMNKLRFTIPEFVAMTGTPRSKVFNRIKRGELKIVKDGRQTFITAQEAERYAKTSHPMVESPVRE
jgi:hypothetical protein